MPLTSVARALGDTEVEPETLASHPSWLFAQKVTVPTREPGLSVTVLVCCRSIGVKDTDKWYAPVAEEILHAPRLDVLMKETRPDPFMRFGQHRSDVYLISPVSDRIPQLNMSLAALKEFVFTDYKKHVDIQGTHDLSESC
ncbi:hypothetical protein KIV65_gp25 [Mycobacterium phage Anthony]|uniref:Uncharacterized protein n=1 Tax=Mycobacterium phage Anthony TaxID=2599857 RepID=A0A5J6TNY5_9CAUD|nr:hypothetical protein KIV65_gp25 [Mycobacterium phage Anthony]QFG10442.1 hypothetical protein PBI_ANTHONY_72 [Mycobacterium phage Anthony]